MNKYLTILRLKEIVGKAGFFMVGVFFSKPAITEGNILITIQFFALCLVNGIAVYLINAGLGYQQDKTNKRLQTFQQINPSSILLGGFLLLIVSFIWLYLFSQKLLLPALVVYVIWIIYSLPNGLKGFPVMGLLCAFVAQIFHFHIGYMVFAEWTNTSILLSIYFALLFAGGHALHEVIDYDADKLSGLKTSAIYFGRSKVFVISNCFFAASVLYLIALALYDVLDWIHIIPYVFAFIIQLWSLLRLPKDLNNDQLFDFRRKYMTAYLLATIAVTLILYL